jgi:hypothetical protein
MTAVDDCAGSTPLPSARSAQRPLERGGREVLDRQREDVAVGAEALEGPGQVGLNGDADRATGRDDAEQDAGAVGALGAAGEEHVEAELGDGLELALGGRVVDRDVGIVEEPDVELIRPGREPSRGQRVSLRRTHVLC